MNSINAAIQNALNYSQAVDFIFAILAPGILYLLRLQYKIIYGLIEVIVGLYLASFLSRRQEVSARTLMHEISMLFI